MFGSYSGISFPTVLQLLIHWSMSNVIHHTKPTKCTVLFLRYLYYNITLNIATCFGSQGIICANFQIKYLGCFQDTEYQDPAHLCTTVHRNVYILTIWLFCNTSAVYKSGWFGFMCYYFGLWGTTVAQLVEALRYKSEGSGFDSWWCHWNFSLT